MIKSVHRIIRSPLIIGDYGLNKLSWPKPFCVSSVHIVGRSCHVKLKNQTEYMDLKTSLSKADPRHLAHTAPVAGKPLLSFHHRKALIARQAGCSCPGSEARCASFESEQEQPALGARPHLTTSQAAAADFASAHAVGGARFGRQRTVKIRLSSAAWLSSHTSISLTPSFLEAQLAAKHDILG